MVGAETDTVKFTMSEEQWAYHGDDLTAFIAMANSAGPLSTNIEIDHVKPIVTIEISGLPSTMRIVREALVGWKSYINLEGDGRVQS